MATWMDNQQTYTFRGRNIKSCHLMADSTEELVAMAERLGLKRQWIQKPGTAHEHFDLMGQAKFNAALRAGVELLERLEFVNRIRAKRGQDPLVRRQK